MTTGKPGPLLPALLERIPLEVLERFRMEDDPNADPKTDPKVDPKTDPPEGNLDSLPQWARDAITKGNNEAAKYRTKVKELEPLATKAKELEDAGKTEVQKATDAAAAEKRRADDAEARALRLEVAMDKGLPAKLAGRLVGASKEELEADAADLLATLGGKPGGTPPPGGKPQVDLRGGGDPTEEPAELDPVKLAAGVPRF